MSAEAFRVFCLKWTYRPVVRSAQCCRLSRWNTAAAMGSPHAIFLYIAGSNLDASKRSYLCVQVPRTVATMGGIRDFPMKNDQSP